jgi:pullulanase/glycogen debranching enzyme
MIASPQQVVFPSRATHTADFSAFSRGATRIDLLFIDRENDVRPSQVMVIDPFVNRTYGCCHVFMPRLDAGQTFGFRASGPFWPERGVGFHSSERLLDPYARAFALAKHYSRDAACSPGDNAPPALATPHHTCERNADQPVAAQTCRAAARSVVVLVAERIGSPCSCN